MSEATLTEAIYEKYIQPIKRKRRKYVGVEFELPIVNLDKKAVDFNVVHDLTDKFIKEFNFDKVQLDDNGDIFSALSSETGDDLSYDCSYNTLELSFGLECDLNVLHLRFVRYYSFIQKNLHEHNHTLTGMGTNPYYSFNRNEPIPNERYRMLFHHLYSYTKYGNVIPFHTKPNFGLFSCASQVQLDVEEENVVDVLNTFTKLEPIKAVLFANSPLGGESDVLCNRDNFWKNSLHGLNRHNVDMYEVDIHSVDEIVQYIKSMSIYCIKRDGKYINFKPTPLKCYFESDEIKGELFDGEKYQEVTFKPELSDLEYLRSFKFEDLTYRGTVEFRSVCGQPVSEIMSNAALHAGLMENLQELADKLNNDTVIYQKGYNASELRALFNKRELPDFIDLNALSGLILEVLDIARDGLKKRGYDEEKFLDPLYIRAKSLCSPARYLTEGLESGVPIESFIEEYARL